MKIFGALMIYLFIGGMVAGAIDAQYQRECRGNAPKMTVEAAAVVSATWPQLFGAMLSYSMMGHRGTITCPASDQPAAAQQPVDTLVRAKEAPNEGS